MAFGTELRSRAAHEALLTAQDAEIQLLESMKKSISLRIKCDRDYAQALSVMVSGAQKLDATSSGLPAQSAWVSILSETETLIQLVRDNADKLFQNTLDAVTNLIGEKKALRKLYGEERARLESDLQKFQNSVYSLQTEYRQRVVKLQQNKLKYEDILKKGKPAQKVSECQAKYVKCVSRVHNIHNDYVLALSEANLFQQHYSNVLLPSLLDFQQRCQETLVQQCKDTLLEYCMLTNSSTDDFRKIHENIRVAVERIDPNSEYKEFVLRHRSEPVSFPPLAFQLSVLDNSPSTSLQPEQINIDDSTVECVKHKLKTYSENLDRTRQQITNKRSEIEVIQGELERSDSSPTSVVTLARRRTIEQLKRELMEQQCNEEKLTAIASLLTESLKELGSSPPPPAIPNVADISQMIDGESTLSSSRLAAALNNVQHGVSQFRTIVKRIGRQHPTILPPTPSVTYDYDYSASRNNSSVTDSTSNGPRTSEICNTAPADGYQQFEFPADDSQQLTLNPGRPLDDEEWYHGVLPREEVQRLLVNDGDYLVRSSKNRTTKETQYVLSVMWQTHRHFIIQVCEGGFRFEGDPFPTIQELIFHHHQDQLAVTRKSDAKLKRPILRADWELRNDDIELHQKIGSGQFGEVFRGTYKLTGEPVAVKTCRETLSDDVKRKFLQEGRILKQYDHPNIVRFIGIAAQRHPVMIVMEYVSGGALLSYLRKPGEKPSQKILVKMCKDAASGMAYLEEKNCLHRDLAARNCLVDSDNTVKISDFGMSREEQEYVVSGGLKQIPIKWTAPEALNYGTYTSACDVWSYGVLMWEVFSFGAVPYPGLTNAQARDKVDEGYRMPPPDDTPDQIYQLMMRCWEHEAKKRPRFAEIEIELDNIIEKLV